MCNMAATNHKCPCGICSRPVNRNDEAIRCGICLYWIHYKCNGLSLDHYCPLHQVMRYGIVMHQSIEIPAPRPPQRMRLSIL